MIYPRQRLAVVLGLLLVAAAGCASRPTVAPEGAEHLRCNIAANKLDMSPDSTAQPPTFLLLSGGGSHGAWGAGFLKGWSDADQTDRPGHFTVVTGVSTGALQATYAFLGTKDDYERLDQLYRGSSAKDIYRERFLLSLPFSSSLRTTDPLRKRLEAELNSATIARVADEASSRLLCVASVNLSTGRTEAWDLTGIAQRARESSGDEKRQWEDFYRAVVLSSASIPVLFPPVTISRNGASDQYVDGGTRDNVFVAFTDLFETIQAQFTAAGRDLRSADGPGPRVFVIINGPLEARAQEVAQRILPIAARSLDLVLTENNLGNIRKIEDRLQSRFPDWELKITHIDPDFAIPCQSSEFIQECMQKLAAEGFDDGKETVWRDPPRTTRAQ